MKKVIKICAWVTGVVAIVCLALMLISNQIVVNNAKGKCFSDIDSIESKKVGLLLGTTPQTRYTKVTNYFFIYRIDAAEQLYKAGKIEKILISGDEHSLEGVNEPECMRDSLVARGIPASAIYLDGKGYRTINSIVNADKAFGVWSYIIISQRFHNERALYLAEHLGLYNQWLQAYNAKDPNTKRAFLTTIREYFARVKMFLDLCNRRKYIMSWTSQYDNCGGDKCPRCGSTYVGRYIYGYIKPPAEGTEAYEMRKKGLIIAGGCCVSDDSPEFRCNDCGIIWGKRIMRYRESKSDN